MHSKKVRRFINNSRLRYYQHIFTPLKVLAIRHKKHIKVVFALADLSAWKSELLYQAMLAHPRFDPILAIVKSTEEDDSQALRSYFEAREYDYVTLADNETICNRLSPDIIFYQKPYESVLYPPHNFLNNLQALFCYVIYSMRSSTESWATDTLFSQLCWQVYYENELNLRTYSKINANRAVNGLATGLPVQDELLIPADQVPDPWKPSSGKKRIIYAPHHSIDPENWMHLSTFLSTGEAVLQLAEKYSDRIQWAFKPHPLLRAKLEKVWGKDKTDSYYSRWTSAPWSQFESGKYLGLFKHSDGMIHDCGSFTMEYLAMDRPVMYLMRSPDVAKDCNEMHQRALDVHYRGATPELIERFIGIVLSGNDSLSTARRQFVRDYLTPPPPASACENIIEAILQKSKKFRNFAL